jgi:hypothetical protein
MGQGVTICSRKMRQTHLPHNLDRKKDASKRYAAPVEEKELEGLRLEWSYLEGRYNHLLCRILREI